MMFPVGEGEPLCVKTQFPMILCNSQQVQLTDQKTLQSCDFRKHKSSKIKQVFMRAVEMYADVPLKDLQNKSIRVFYKSRKGKSI